MRWRVGAVIAVVGFTVLTAGCTTQVTGVAQRAPYRPLPLGSLTARMATPVAGALAYSLDGAMSLVWDGDRHTACVRPGGTCLTLPDDVAPGIASFSPGGRYVVVAEDYRRDFRGRLWLLPVAGGGPAEIPASPDCDPKAPSSSAAGPTTRVTTPPAPSPGATAPTSKADDTPAMYTDAVWLDSDTLLALEAGVGLGSCLVRIPVHDPRPKPVAAAPGDDAAYPPLAIGGGTAVVGLAVPVKGNNSLLVVDLATGATRTVTPGAGAVGLRRVTSLLPLAVSPDGTTALLKLTDDADYRTVQLAALNLASSSMTKFDGWGSRGDGSTALDDGQATFSPDGSQVIALAFRGEDASVLLAGSRAGGALTRVGDFPVAAPVIGRMAWTDTDLLVPVLAVPGRLSAAPWQLSG